MGLQKIVLISTLFLVAGVAHASDAPEKVSVRDVSRHFQDSQHLMEKACQTKGVERALRSLEKAEGSLKEAKKVLKSHAPENQVEVRMQSRLMYKLDQDIQFINQVKSDLGLAEVDSLDSYIQLRKSLIQDAEQRSDVVKMDHQILLTLEAHSLNKI